jgi:hypothetical protein
LLGLGLFGLSGFLAILHSLSPQPGCILYLCIVLL